MIIRTDKKHGFLFVETDDKVYLLTLKSSDKLKEHYSLEQLEEGIKFSDDEIELINVDINDKTILNENNEPKKLCETIKMAKLKYE